MKLRDVPLLFAIFAGIIPGAMAQIHVSPGIVSGISLTDTLNSSSFSDNSSTSTDGSRYNSVTKRLLIGPSLRLDLPRGLALEFDALYQRVDFDYATNSSQAGSYSTQSFEQGTGNRWEFPLLVQYSWTARKIRPFVEAGPSISTIVNGRSTLEALTMYVPSPTQTNTSTENLPAITTAGITAGAGIAIPLAGHHIRAEIRFSHWFNPVGTYNGAAIITAGVALTGVLTVPPVYGAPYSSSTFNTKQNEATFVLGLSF